MLVGRIVLAPARLIRQKSGCPELSSGELRRGGNHPTYPAIANFGLRIADLVISSIESLKCKIYHHPQTGQFTVLF